DDRHPALARRGHRHARRLAAGRDAVSDPPTGAEPMRVAIRADASARIGSGHVVRCLALADGLAARGGEVTFVTRELPPHLRDAVLRSGHRHVSLALPIPGGLDAPQEPWPQDQQLLDAASTREALVAFKPEWLVVDHYGLAEHWETDMHASGV